MTNIFLSAEPADGAEPIRIIVRDTQKQKIAIIFRDGVINVSNRALVNDEAQQIDVVAKHFWLFYDNLFEAYNRY